MHKHPLPASIPNYFAHRGDCDSYPENSLPAICSAQSLGAAVEFDVRKCRDELVVFHDADLARMCGRQLVLEDCAWSELQQIPLLHFSPTFIPSFSQVLQSCSGKTLLNIELKQAQIVPEVVRSLEAIIASKQAVWTDFLISSFDVDALSDLRQALAEAPLAILTRDRPENAFALAEKIEACAIHLNIKRVNAQTVSAIHDRGLLVGLYPVDDDKLIKLAEHYGADYIFSRYPGLAKNFGRAA